MKYWQRKVCAEAGFPDGLDRLIGKRLLFTPDESSVQARHLRNRGFKVAEARSLITGGTVDTGSDAHVDYERATLHVTVEACEAPVLIRTRLEFCTYSDGKWHFAGFPLGGVPGTVEILNA